MTFEEFFKKKKINLTTLEQAEPPLFAEFKAHYEQMGEKSFDHTKKYWFNKLRLKFPAPVEIKTEKIKIENQLAEQTITEMLAEPGNTPKPVFKPRFKAPAASLAGETAPPEPLPPPDTIPKVGFKPLFKASALPTITNTVPAADEITAPLPAIDQPVSPSVTTTPKVGFKPRFKASAPPVTISQEAIPEDTSTVQTIAEAVSAPAQAPVVPLDPEQTNAPSGPAATKVSFKPRFKMQVKPKPEENEE